MKIVFMGTPDFAVPCLEALIQDGNTIAAVFTQPDKPKGRGYRLEPPPVKVCAEAHQIPVYQLTTLKDGTALAVLQELAPDMIVVVAYGKILPKDILTLPPYGCINVHASLLPAYRGAAPIQWVILDGRKETGVTAMLMDVGLDTGDMLMKASLTEMKDKKVITMGSNDMGLSNMPNISSWWNDEKQDDSQSCYAAMLTKELSPIDFTKTAQQVHDKVRGLNSWPSASAVLNGKRLKIHRTIITEGHGEPGQVLSLQPLVVACGEGAVEIIEVQPEGKKKMSAQSYLNGLHGLSADELRFS